MKSEYNRILGLVRIVPAGGMERAAMKKQHVSGLQFRGEAPAYQFLILREVFSEENIVIKLFRAEIHAVRPRDQFETAVLFGFLPQCEPDVDEFPPCKRPITDILMPAGVAAVLGSLGHDAIVMSQRTVHIRPQELPQAFGYCLLLDPFEEDKVAAYRLLETSDRLSARDLPRGRRAGILQICLELDGRALTAEIIMGDLQHSSPQRFIRQPSNDDESIILELLLLGRGKRLGYAF